MKMSPTFSAPVTVTLTVLVPSCGVAYTSRPFVSDQSRTSAFGAVTIWMLSVYCLTVAPHRSISTAFLSTSAALILYVQPGLPTMRPPPMLAT